MEQLNAYIESLSEHFDDIPWMRQLAARFNLKTAHVALLVVLVAFVMVFSGVLDYLVCNLIGTVYPAYLSFKAIESKGGDDDKQWLTYWVVFAIYSVVDDFSGVLLFWLPFYYPIKLAMLIWLVWPKTRGALVIYEKVIKPLLKRFEGQIDEKLRLVNEKAEEASKIGAGLAAKGQEFAMQKGVGYMMSGKSSS